MIIVYFVVTDENRNMSFKLARESDELWWELQEYSPRDPFYPDPSTYHWEKYLTFIVISDRVAPPSLSFLTGYGLV